MKQASNKSVATVLQRGVSSCHGAGTYEDGIWIKCSECQAACRVVEANTTQCRKKEKKHRNSVILDPVNRPEFELFVKWYSLPKMERVPKTTMELIKELGVCAKTLWNWSRMPEFEERTKKQRAEWVKDKIPDVVKALHLSCLEKRRAAEIELFLRYAKDYTPVSKQDSTINLTWEQMMDRIQRGTHEHVDPKNALPPGSKS